MTLFEPLDLVTPADHAFRVGAPAGQAHPGPPLVPSMVGHPRIKRLMSSADWHFDADLTRIDHCRAIANQYAICSGSVLIA